MKHFFRTDLPFAVVLSSADRFFPTLGLDPGVSDARSRGFTGALGRMRLMVRTDGGHYTVVEVRTDQVGESRLDKNVKQFFVTLHRASDPRHRLEAGY